MKIALYITIHLCWLPKLKMISEFPKKSWSWAPWKILFLNSLKKSCFWDPKKIQFQNSLTFFSELLKKRFWFFLIASINLFPELPDFFLSSLKKSCFWAPWKRMFQGSLKNIRKFSYRCQEFLVKWLFDLKTRVNRCNYWLYISIIHYHVFSSANHIYQLLSFTLPPPYIVKEVLSFTSEINRNNRNNSLCRLFMFYMDGHCISLWLQYSRKMWREFGFFLSKWEFCAWEKILIFGERDNISQDFLQRR